jgi:lipopolysaccharide/colanic/teichoic acid biosynthesis glycosyltransferase
MKLESSGPMFYSQKRVGRNGRLFTAYKLRSMPNDAEANGPVITALDGDKRPGRIGRFIRKSKIDELPQFWNVLIGEMSVVGPRPERPYFVDKFSREFPNFSARHLVRPGVTGLAQIKEKDSLQIRSKLRYDLLYINKRSFGFDMAILWSTIWFCFHYLFEAMGILKSSTNGNGGPTELK